MKDMKILLQEWKKYEKTLLTEEADPAKFDFKRFPKGLSQVDPAAAKLAVKAGNDEYDEGTSDDEISVDLKGTWSAAQLLPSQNSMNLGKAAWFALGMANGTMFQSGGPGGNIGAFVSGDNYMMDGHHRWAATAMIKPAAPIHGYAVQFPGKALVRILNTITKGLLGVNKGKPGKGNFAQFHDLNKVKTVLTNLAQDMQPNGKGGTFAGVAGSFEPGKALEVMEKLTGQEGEAAIDATAQLMVKNVKAVKGMNDANVMPGASSRIDMPVIDVEDGPVQPADKLTIKALQTGQVDVNPPYGPPGKDKSSAQTSPIERRKAAAMAENLDVDALANKLTETIIRSLKK